MSNDFLHGSGTASAPRGVSDAPGRRARRGAAVTAVAIVITSLVVGLTIVGGLRLVADHDELVASTGQGTNGPLAGILVSFAGCMLFAGLGGIGIGVNAGAWKSGVLRSLAIAAIGAVFPALAALAAVAIAQTAWPILTNPPGSSPTSYANLAVVTLVCTAAGAVFGWGLAMFARFVRRRRNERTN